MFVVAPPVVGVTPHVQEAHFLHLQPISFIRAATPTNTYTTASIVGILPKTILTTFQLCIISIPTPTRPQLRPPIPNKILLTIETAHPPPLHPQDPHIIFIQN